MAVERITPVPETAALLPSPELPKEERFTLADTRFRRLQTKLKAIREFNKALRSTPPKDGKILSGNFEFELAFEGRNYKNKVTLEENGGKKIKWERSFDLSFIGPTITEISEVEVSQRDPSWAYSYEVSDDPKATIREKNTQKGLTGIDTFVLV